MLLKRGRHSGPKGTRPIYFRSDYRWQEEPPVQPVLFPIGQFPERLKGFPQTRYMGSKYRLLPWMHRVFSEIEFDTVLDACSGSGCVAYLFKATGKEVTANDSLHMSATLAQALIENSNLTLDRE